ncbi:uncharacterized protein LOC120033729 [Salvelinus namaycush]|uniref:Uncharacterized protein LOC120033729 n=1 Tax=Salvelinus namaycush TaxID=8040 RepID=A0A8U0Q3D6_SALNM|nr:uncharacterized protein LOC120033729 [Salvelinus namaycush]
MAKEFLLENKPLLTEILSAEPDNILQYAHSKKLVEQREYNNLNHLQSSQPPETTVIKLLDRLRERGEEYCHGFVALLHKQEIIANFPRLKELDWTTFKDPSAPDPPRAPPSIRAGSIMGNLQEVIKACGYIHNVSAVKRGKKTGYFNAVLQQEDESRNLIVFQPQLRDRFATAESRRTPVKLVKVVLQPSISRNNKMEIMFKYTSTFSILEDLPFKFNSDLDGRVKDVALADLQEDKENTENAVKQKVNVTVEVIQKVKEGHCKTRFNKSMPMVEYLVGDIVDDSTTLTNLTVWGRENTVEVGKWYRVTNVSVVKYGGKTVLNTTPESTLVNVASGRKCDLPHDMVQPEKFEGKIIGYWLSQEYTCPEAHPLERVDTTEKMVTCKHCPMSYILSLMGRITRGKLSIQSDDLVSRVFTVEDRVIRNILRGRLEGRESLKDIEDALVELPPVTVTVLNGHVLTVTTQSHDVTTQDEKRNITAQQRV